MNQQINLNNNFNVNPFIAQPNLQMNQPIINMNPIISNNINSFPNDEIINVTFERDYGNGINIRINPNEKISELIKRYREKSKDYNNNMFLFNGKNIENYSSLSLTDYGIRDMNKITVFLVQLKGEIVEFDIKIQFNFLFKNNKIKNKNIKENYEFIVK